ncbi:MAG: hypothetical protein COV47_05280 [Candidatus Diapherotrites archaeon CG11_big_fil_rev_8_21_14_0_20_37_9]|nr:MAG: hypothetical protein COV47_05280 [Candidatus Diapherotrites archaeon CG11_big_fil_rev_8_21_14_0_20_37_9]
MFHRRKPPLLLDLLGKKSTTKLPPNDASIAEIEREARRQVTGRDADLAEKGGMYNISPTDSNISPQGIHRRELPESMRKLLDEQDRLLKRKKSH